MRRNCDSMLYEESHQAEFEVVADGKVLYVSCEEHLGPVVASAMIEGSYTCVYVRIIRNENKLQSA